MVRQVTAKSRYARALAAVTDWCRSNRHQTIRDQHTHLTMMMRGHYAYYGISGNINDCTGTPIRSSGSGRNRCRAARIVHRYLSTRQSVQKLQMASHAKAKA